MVSVNESKSANEPASGPATEAPTKGNGAEEPSDPFDIESFALRGDPRLRAAVKRVWTSVPERKPRQGEFFWVRAEEALRVAVSLLRHERDHYLVTPDADLSVPTNCRFEAVVYCCINRQNELFAWCVPLFDSRGNANRWYQSAHEAADTATKYWTVIEPGPDGYVASHAANNELSEPLWPEELDGSDGPQWFYGLVFKARVVRGMDHSIARQLAGLE